MHRNTYTLVIILAIFAALVVGVNIGRNITDSENRLTQTISPSPIVTHTPQPTAPTATILTYTNRECGITLSYPSSMNPVESSGSGVIFTDTQNPKETVVLACQKDIPRPPLMDSKMEKIKIGSVSAVLYHDASAKDGTPIDKLIFTNPKTKMDVYMAGIGNVFDSIIGSISIML